MNLFTPLNFEEHCSGKTVQQCELVVKCNFSHHKKEKKNKGKTKHLRTMFEITNALFIVPEMLNEYLQLLHKMA